MPLSRTGTALKRTFDIACGLLGLTLAAVPMALIALLVKAGSKGPALFMQLRPGLDGKPFQLIKFRTMRAPREGEASGAADEARLTGFGRYLRRWSLDELPELWNVLKGDMSLVGPRPLLMEYLLLYSPEQARRHLVRPGITGWAQVNGRNAISWEEKFVLDVWYIDHTSLALDARILWLTALKTIGGEGISQPGHATMEAFRGTAGRRGERTGA